MVSSPSVFGGAVSAGGGEGGDRLGSGSRFQELAGALYGEALFIEQALDFEHHLDVLTAIEAVAGAGLLGAEPGELEAFARCVVLFDGADPGQLARDGPADRAELEPQRAAERLAGWRGRVDGPRVVRRLDAARQWKQLERDRGNNAKRALAADEQLLEIVAAVVLAQRIELLGAETIRHAGRHEGGRHGKLRCGDGKRNAGND